MNTAPNGWAFPASIRVQVCRGCCCGTERKHPETDHDGQLAAIAAVARTRVVDCVDECAYSNVVIVRRGDGTSVWLGGINDAALTDAVCEWLVDGAAQPPPPVLQSKVFIRTSSAVGADAEDVEPVSVRLEPAGVQRLVE